MNPETLLLAGFTGLLLVLLVWALRSPNSPAKSNARPTLPEESDRPHVTYLSQMRQAMANEDIAFLASRGSRELIRRVRRERRKIALVYLGCLHNDFLNLWRLARVIASMAPQVGVPQELERLCLGLTFSLRYQLIRCKLLVGFAPLPELGSLSEAVSRLAMRLETAMNDLGERAVLAARLTSSPDGHGLDTP